MSVWQPCHGRKDPSAQRNPSRTWNVYTLSVGPSCGGVYGDEWSAIGPPRTAQNLRVDEEGNLTMFVSHQWRHRHPDASGKVQVLRSALKNLIEGTVMVEETVVMQFSGIASKFPKPAELEKAFIWMDWFSIPQVEAAKDEVAKSQAARQAGLAILSIPLYVAASDVFLALVPRLHHTNTGFECSHSSWVGRGWCRLEMWCHLLSTQSEFPIAVAYGPEHLQFAMPNQWVNNFVHQGTFTVEADRAECCQVVRKTLDEKLDRLGRETIETIGHQANPD